MAPGGSGPWSDPTWSLEPGAPPLPPPPSPSTGMALTVPCSSSQDSGLLISPGLGKGRAPLTSQVQVYPPSSITNEDSKFAGGRRAPEKAMAPHASALAWKIPWTEEPGGL